MIGPESKSLDNMLAPFIAEAAEDLADYYEGNDRSGYRARVEKIISLCAESYYFDHGKPDLNDPAEAEQLATYLGDAQERFAELAEEDAETRPESAASNS